MGGRFKVTLDQLELSTIDKLGHAVEVDQQAQEHFVCGRAIFVDAGEVTEDGDAGDILAVEREHARGLRAEAAGPVWKRNMAMDTFMVHIVGRGDLGEKACDHFDDVRNRHGADLELPVLRRFSRDLRSRRLCQELLAGKALDM